MIRKMFLLLLVFFMGCSSLTPFPLEEELALGKVGTRKPLEFKVAVLPLQVNYKATTELTNPEEFYPTIDKRTFVQSFADLLKKYKLFSSSQGKTVEIYSEEKDWTRKGYFKKAWAEKKDFLVEIELERYKLSYGGVGTGTYLLNLFFWFYLWVPSWWVADEMYVAEMDLKVRLYSVHSGKLLREYKIVEKREDYLNDWDRGWKILGIFTVPSYLSKSNWMNIQKSMDPWIIKKVQKEFLVKLDGDFRILTFSKEFEEKNRKTLAMVVGISNYKDGNIKSDQNFSAPDAQTIYSLLSPRTRETIRLLDDQASRNNIYRTLQDFLSHRVRDTDTVIFYFAGYGASLRKNNKGKTEFYLIPHDASFRALPQSSIPLSNLLVALASFPAKRIWVILDTSLGGRLNPQGSSGRSLTYEWNHRILGKTEKDLKPLQGEIQNSLSKFKTLPPGITLLLSCAPSQDSLELVENQRGLFNFYLTKKLGELGMKREVLVKDLFDYILKKVASRAKKRYGIPQEVQCFPNLSPKSLWRLGDMPVEASEEKSRNS